jgi:hypothetical protein
MMIAATFSSRRVQLQYSETRNRWRWNFLGFRRWHRMKPEFERFVPSRAMCGSERSSATDFQSVDGLS